mmetsp:Transcript_21340/g.29355  ORF Transcript_21340/g.29355 Transcript_21340/m.29355 type:complete len:93 (+) Transcript_21340:674-952(+)
MESRGKPVVLPSLCTHAEEEGTCLMKTSGPCSGGTVMTGTGNNLLDRIWQPHGGMNPLTHSPRYFLCHVIHCPSHIRIHSQVVGQVTVCALT